MTRKTLWLLTAAVFTGLLLPALVQEGMFLDGVSYACIARNMASGLGDFAHPHYTAALYPVCYEQPPLALWLQSLFFSVLGDHFWVERLYSLGMAVLTVLGILLNWRIFVKTDAGGAQSVFASDSWLPVLLWITTPVVFWGYQNNMLECTMSVFVLFSSYFAAKSVAENRPVFLLAAALFSCAAVLSKGPVGFFPAAVPFVFGLVSAQKGRVTALAYSAAVLALSVGLLYLVILLIPGMSAYLDYYLHKQLLPTLAGAREKQVDNPFSFLLDLLAQIALPALVLIGLLVKNRFKAILPPQSARYFLLMGLAGSLPLVLTPKQSLHYLLPSIPFFALGFAAWIRGFLIPESENASQTSLALPVEQTPYPLPTKRKKRFEKIAWLVLAFTVLVSVSFWGKYRRDRTKIQDVKAICQQVGATSMLGAPQHFSSDWLLIAYFERMGNVSLDTQPGHDFWLMEKGGNAPEGYVEINSELSGYSLWKKK